MTDDAVPEEQRLVVGATEKVWLAEEPQEPETAVGAERQALPFQLVPVTHIAEAALLSRTLAPSRIENVLEP
jgi:hypothetical protein